MKRRLRALKPVKSEVVSARKFVEIYESNQKNIVKTEFIAPSFGLGKNSFGKFRVTYGSSVLRECYER